MQKQFHIFGLSETWFNGSFSNDAFCVPGYYPLVLLDRPHGGVVVVLLLCRAL